MLSSCGKYTWESLGLQGDHSIHNPKGNQPWIFIGRTDTEAEGPILWPPDAKNQLIEKDPDFLKDWRQEKKGETEEEMVGWHHWHNGHEFEQTLGDSEEQGWLARCSPWGRRELGHHSTTEQQQHCELDTNAVQNRLCVNWMRKKINICVWTTNYDWLR